MNFNKKVYSFTLHRLEPPADPQIYQALAVDRIPSASVDYSWTKISEGIPTHPPNTIKQEDDRVEADSIPDSGSMWAAEDSPLSIEFEGDCECTLEDHDYESRYREPSLDFAAVNNTPTPK